MRRCLQPESQPMIGREDDFGARPPAEEGGEVPLSARKVGWEVVNVRYDSRFPMSKICKKSYAGSLSLASCSIAGNEANFSKSKTWGNSTATRIAFKTSARVSCGGATFDASTNKLYNSLKSRQNSAHQKLEAKRGRGERVGTDLQPSQPWQ